MRQALLRPRPGRGRTLRNDAEPGLGAHATPDAREPPAQKGLCFSALSVGGGALADPVGRCRDYRESGSPFPSPPAPSLARLSAKHHTRILVEKVS